MPGVSSPSPSPSAPSPSPVDSPNFRAALLESVHQEPWKQTNHSQKMSQSGFEDFVACLQTEEERQEDAWDHNVFLSAGAGGPTHPCTTNHHGNMTRSKPRNLHPALINHPALDLSYDFGDLDAEKEVLADISSCDVDDSDVGMTLSESVWQALLVINCDLVINGLLTNNQPEASPASVGSLTACSGGTASFSSASTAYYCSLDSWEKSDGSSSSMTSDLRTDSLGIDSARFEESRRIVGDLQDLALRLRSEGVAWKRQYDDFPSGTGSPSSAPREAWLMCPSSPKSQMSSSELTDISYHTSFCSSDPGGASYLDFAFPVLTAPVSSPSGSATSGTTLSPWDY